MSGSFPILSMDLLSVSSVGMMSSMYAPFAVEGRHGADRFPADATMSLTMSVRRILSGVLSLVRAAPVCEVEQCGTADEDERGGQERHGDAVAGNPSRDQEDAHDGGQEQEGRR